jgi:hypothetical protein
MRRRIPIPSSLDLLLDAMCNAFGCVILIALVAALLIRDAGKHLYKNSALKNVTSLALERERLLQERLELMFRLERLKRSASTTEAHVSPTDVLRRKFLQAKIQLKKKSTELKSLEESRLVLQRKLKRSTKELETIQRRKTEAREEIGQLEQKISEAVKRSRRNLRLPRYRRTFKAPRWFLVKANRLYPCFSFSGSGSFNDPIHPSVIADRSESSIKISPRIGAGQLLKIGFENESYVAKIKEKISKHSNSLQFIVYPDSFKAFLGLRDSLVKQGYSYNWAPRKEGEALKLSRGGGGSGAQ